jgi:hypothetical protein
VLFSAVLFVHSRGKDKVLNTKRGSMPVIGEAIVTFWGLTSEGI